MCVCVCVCVCVCACTSNEQPDVCATLTTISVQVDKNGTLDYDEFQNLLETLAAWKKMYYMYDKDRSGTLERGEVSAAINSLG